MDARLFFPATENNRGPIWSALSSRLPQGSARVLEVASGSGQHVVHFAAQNPALIWVPSDADGGHRESIRAWRAHARVNNVEDPLELDVRHSQWPSPGEVVAVVAINLVHIAPWEATLGLLRGAANILQAGGFLYLYGAFTREGRHTAPSNEAFDRGLRAQNQEWGVRDLETLEQEAIRCGFGPAQVVEMPANNLSLFFQRGL